MARRRPAVPCGAAATGTQRAAAAAAFSALVAATSRESAFAVAKGPRRAFLAAAAAVAAPSAASAEDFAGWEGKLRAVATAGLALASVGLALRGGRPSVLRGADDRDKRTRSSLAQKASDVTRLQFGVQDPGISLPTGVVRGQAPQHFAVPAQQAEELEVDGVTLVRGALKDWVGFLRSVTDHQVEHPHFWSLVGRGGDSYDYIQRNVWMTNDGFRDFMYYSPLTHVIAQLAKTEEVRPTTDVLIVNPNDGIGWHQDNQNGPIESDYAIRWWVAMDKCGENKVGVPEYLIGSHRNTSVSDAVAVDVTSGDLAQFSKCTDYVVEPGDLIVWNTRSIHRIRPHPSGKWPEGTQRRAHSGTMAVKGASYAPRGAASSISDVAGHSLELGQPLGGPYFPQLYPARIAEEEEARTRGELVSRSPAGLARNLQPLLDRLTGSDGFVAKTYQR